MIAWNRGLMSRCPYCGLKTARTIDWACRWCGHPLVSGRYEKIDKSYAELQEERLRKPVTRPGPGAAPEPAPTQERKPTLAPPATSDTLGVATVAGDIAARAGSSFAVAICYLAAIAAAELVVALVNPLGGIILHIALLLGLVSHASLTDRHPQHKLYLALALAPLIRVLSLSMPLAEFPQIYWYAIIAIPLLLAVFAIMQRLDFRPGQIGLTLNRLPLQFLVALTGIPFGIAEFYILRPNPLVNSLAWEGMVLPALILLVGTGLAEELVFRGVMQRAAMEALGRWGWVYIAGVFTVLHIGYLSLADFGLVLIVGLFFGWVVKKTGSLIGVTLSHWITNIVLYLIVPFLL